jgi:hypothetical protein
VRASLNAVRGFLPIIALAAVVFQGCAVRISSDTRSGQGSPSVTASTGSPVGTAIVVGVMAADAVYYYRMGPDGKTPMYGAPDPDPSRKINVQDCTKPVDFSAGNLLCR